MVARDNLSVFRENKFLRHFFRDSKNIVRIRLADSTTFTYPLDLLKPLSTFAALELFAVVSYLGADFIMTKMESALVKELRRSTLEEPVLVSLESFFARHDYKQCLKEVTALLYTKRRNRIKHFVQDVATNADMDAFLVIIDNSEKSTRSKKRKA